MPAFLLAFSLLRPVGVRVPLAISNMLANVGGGFTHGLLQCYPASMTCWPWRRRLRHIYVRYTGRAWQGTTGSFVYIVTCNRNGLPTTLLVYSKGRYRYQYGTAVHQTVFVLLLVRLLSSHRGPCFVVCGGLLADVRGMLFLVVDLALVEFVRLELVKGIFSVPGC